MTSMQNTLMSIVIILFSIVMLGASDNMVKPVTPNASPEAQALLDFFYNISGKYILTGQHNYPNVKDRNSQFAKRYIGETPVI